MVVIASINSKSGFYNRKNGAFSWLFQKENVSLRQCLKN